MDKLHINKNAKILLFELISPFLSVFGLDFLSIRIAKKGAFSPVFQGIFINGVGIKESK